MEIISEFNTGGSPVIDQHPICMGWRGEGEVFRLQCAQKNFSIPDCEVNKESYYEVHEQCRHH